MSFICWPSTAASPLELPTYACTTASPASGTGAVRPEFRRHGVHSALIARRLALAKHAGAELVVGGASYGSASFRNQQRAGFRLAYIEAGGPGPAEQARGGAVTPVRAISDA